jgi:hypothetical protein
MRSIAKSEKRPQESDKLLKSYLPEPNSANSGFSFGLFKFKSEYSEDSDSSCSVTPLPLIENENEHCLAEEFRPTIDVNNSKISSLSVKSSTIAKSKNSNSRL